MSGDAITKLTKISKTMMPSSIDSYLNGEITFENLCQSEYNDSQKEINRLKETYEYKMKEIDALYKEIIAKDEKINQLNQQKNLQTKSEKKNSQIKKINELERESNEQLKTELNKLKEEYTNQLRSITNEHDKKVKNLRNEIQSLKEQIDVYSDKTKYISKEEHEKILNELKIKHKKELEPFEKEISDLEKFIMENYPNVLNKSIMTNSLPHLMTGNSNTEDNNYLNLVKNRKTNSEFEEIDKGENFEFKINDIKSFNH